MSGTLLQGTVKPNDTLLLGPDKSGDFVPTVIKSIHRRRSLTRVGARSMMCGLTCCRSCAAGRRAALH